MSPFESGLAHLSIQYTIRSVTRHMKKIKRNAPCPCGCGQKFKVCLNAKRDVAYAKMSAERAEREERWRREAFQSQLMDPMCVVFRGS